MSNSDFKVECSICFQEITSKIFQCNNGHIYCELCMNQMNHCGTCRSTNYKIRNKLIEDIIVNNNNNNKNNNDINNDNNNDNKNFDSNKIFLNIINNYNNNIKFFIK